MKQYVYNLSQRLVFSRGYINICFVVMQEYFKKLVSLALMLSLGLDRSRGREMVENRDSLRRIPVSYIYVSG
jgi:hypothetical protein